MEQSDQDKITEEGGQAELPSGADHGGLAMWEDACPYLPDRRSTTEGLAVDVLPGDVYRLLLDGGFRRSGRVIYRPRCHGCQECVPIRVKVADFRPDKSQRRCWRANQDLRVTVAVPVLTEEKWQLYARYVRTRHGEVADTSMGALQRFLYDSPTQSLEMTYRDPAGRLLAVGLCDEGTDFLSTVYCYFDPAESRRGLGTFSALWEIQFAQSRIIGYYYMGFVIAGCRAMRYKAAFRPFELLGEDGVWRSGQALGPVNG